MKVVRVLALVLSSIMVIVIVDQYLFCPVYSFERSTSFSGDLIYNPYSSAMTGKWVKCNFHTHTRCWNGFTNGKGTADDVFSVYGKLKYDIHAISNYQSIDTTHRCNSSYMSCYEHGYNILKCHQLVLGARSVCWKDYLLPQTLSNKQDIIDKLNNAAPGGLVVLNHPLERNGYRASDFKYLTNYACMEVLNPSCNSAALWDECLSAGKPVFIIGNDDCHNVFDSTGVGAICTWINVTQPDRKTIIEALKTGASYATRVGSKLMEEVRNGNDNGMPTLQQFVVIADSIYAKFNLPAKELIVTGKDGCLLHKVYDTNAVAFNLAKSEPYARITAKYDNGTEVLLNPVFRYNKTPFRQASANIDTAKTLGSRAIGVLALTLWFGFVLRLLLSKNNQYKLLPNILTGYEYVSGLSAKNTKVRYRWSVWHFRRFFSDMDFERESEVE